MTGRPRWLPPVDPDTAPAGELIDLSVGADEESYLGHSRWKAAVLVHDDKVHNPANDAALISTIDGHLRGRRPIAGRYRGDLMVTFTIRDDPASRELVRNFATSLATCASSSAEPARVEIEFYEVESRDLEPVLPEHRRSHDF